MSVIFPLICGWLCVVDLDWGGGHCERGICLWRWVSQGHSGGGGGRRWKEQEEGSNMRG